jgi:hypothetical protein
MIAASIGTVAVGETETIEAGWLGEGTSGAPGHLGAPCRHPALLDHEGCSSPPFLENKGRGFDSRGLHSSRSEQRRPAASTIRLARAALTRSTHSLMAGHSQSWLGSETNGCDVVFHRSPSYFGNSSVICSRYPKPSGPSVGESAQYFKAAPNETYCPLI